MSLFLCPLPSFSHNYTVGISFEVNILKTIMKRTPAGFNNLPSMFDDIFFNEGNVNTSKRKFTPAVNIKETEAMFFIEMALPGYLKEDISIQVENELLTISSEKINEKTEEGETFTKREFNLESFSRSFTLPEIVDIENISANNSNGILFVTLPKNKALLENKVKTISIK